MELRQLFTTIAAAEYGCDAYGANAFGECSTSTGGGGSTAPNGGGLADTGYDILVPLALGLSILIASAILLVKRLVRAKRSRV